MADDDLARVAVAEGIYEATMTAARDSAAYDGPTWADLPADLRAAFISTLPGLAVHVVQATRAIFPEGADRG